MKVTAIEVDVETSDPPIFLSLQIILFFQDVLIPFHILPFILKFLIQFVDGFF